MLSSLFEYAKDIGSRLFTSDEEAGENILNHILANNPGVDPLRVAYDDGLVTLSGKAEDMAAKEKTILMAGNVRDVEKVNADALEIPQPAPEAPEPPRVQYYTIERGDTLSGIARTFYGNAMKYPAIFEANREVIEDPDRIYPGQKIRIPDLA